MQPIPYYWQPWSLLWTVGHVISKASTKLPASLCVIAQIASAEPAQCSAMQGGAPSKKEAPASAASWAKLDARRALRPALGAAPNRDPRVGDLGAGRPGFKVELVMDVVGISTFSDGFSCNHSTAHSAEGKHA